MKKEILLKKQEWNQQTFQKQVLKEQLFLALGNIDEETIQKAAPASKQSDFYPIHKLLLSTGSILLCLITALFIYNNFITQSDPIPRKLPILTIEINTELGMGGDDCGLLVHDYNELKDTNPWSEKEELTTLPVFKNLDYPIIHCLEQQQTMDMEQYQNQLLKKVTDIGKRLEKISSQFKIESVSLEKDNIIAKGNGFSINASCFESISLYFDPTLSLPKEYSFDMYASYKELQKTAEYLKKEYQQLIDLPDAAVNISNPLCNFNGNAACQIQFFNSKGSIEEQILNYNFHPIEFLQNHNGELWIIRFHETDLSEKIGDYPIITAEEAKKLLLNGNYINCFSNEFPQKDSIIETKLIYHRSSEYFIPYYRFAVALHSELPEYVTDKTLLQFDYYYVPAVKSQYLANFPVWDGSINND